MERSKKYCPERKVLLKIALLGTCYGTLSLLDRFSL